MQPLFQNSDRLSFIIFDNLRQPFLGSALGPTGQVFDKIALIRSGPIGNAIAVPAILSDFRDGHMIGDFGEVHISAAGQAQNCFRRWAQAKPNQEQGHGKDSGCVYNRPGLAQ
jgi:hypothetical protein